MKKPQFSTRLARKTRQTRPAAADQLDRVVHDILERLRRGQPAELPGLGRLVPCEGQIRFEMSKDRAQ